MRIDRAGTPFLLIFAALSLLALWWKPWIAAPFVALLLFTAWFFRDPERVPPGDPGAVLSPADGKIIVAGPERVSVFLNVFNVHVCRAPVTGRVVSVRHVPGRFVAAFRDDASELNERAIVTLEGDAGSMRVTLVAGLIARRIVCRVKEGQTLEAGERLGIIRFGSRVDVDVPREARLEVEVGDGVSAGTSVIARLRDPLV